MWSGTVHGLFTAAESEAPMQARSELNLIPGVGVEGDRYAARRGRFSSPARTGQELTLIEQEAIDAVKAEYSIELEPGATRRNVVTAGVALNHLVGREFYVGAARVKGVRLNEPCSHLAKLNGIPRLKKALAHRGGLRAQVIEGGVIKVGDRVRPA